MWDLLGILRCLGISLLKCVVLGYGSRWCSVEVSFRCFVGELEVSVLSFGVSYLLRVFIRLVLEMLG